MKQQRVLGIVAVKVACTSSAASGVQSEYERSSSVQYLDMRLRRRLQ